MDVSGTNSRTPPANSFNGNQAALLSTAMKLADKLPHELTRDDIMRASYYEGATLSNVISEVFASYKVDQFVWAHTRIETEPADFEDLVAEYRAKYPPPWETFRDILSGMREAAGDEGLFDFDFSDPDGHRLDMGNYEQFSFKTEMTNRTSGAQYELDSLSSGEKVLMALCLTSFNHYLGRRRPKTALARRTRCCASSLHGRGIGHDLEISVRATRNKGSDDIALSHDGRRAGRERYFPRRKERRTRQRVSLDEVGGQLTNCLKVSPRWTRD